MASNYPTPLPQASAPFVDIATGKLTITGYRFVSDLWNRTGAAAGSNSTAVLQSADNLSDVPDVKQARANLGLGSAATRDASAFATAAQGALASTALQPGATINITAVDIGGVQVVGARAGGWGAPTGTLSRAALDTGTATLTQVAQALGALIADLTSHGLIGT
jgi:hypothetical protein